LLEGQQLRNGLERRHVECFNEVIQPSDLERLAGQWFVVEINATD
jgi:hypothetical protein